jgi:hypothetical protein
MRKGSRLPFLRVKVLFLLTGVRALPVGVLNKKFEVDGAVIGVEIFNGAAFEGVANKFRLVAVDVVVLGIWKNWLNIKNQLRALWLKNNTSLNTIA